MTLLVHGFTRAVLFSEGAPVSLRIPVLLLAASLLVTLSACASDEPTGPRLANAKSIVQLVRNEAGDRVPSESVASMDVVTDGSEACLAVDEDPSGKLRRWASTSVVTFNEGDGDTLESIYADVINSFSGNGWSEVSYGGGGNVTLQKPGSDETLAFLATPEDADAGTPASLTIAITSGCVATAGEGSAEVSVLEDAAD